jgi:hypothetical protein
VHVHPPPLQPPLEHTCPHVPQLSGSELVSVQPLEQLWYPGAHTQDPWEQTSPLPHAVQFDPQCDESLLVS